MAYDGIVTRAIVKELNDKVLEGKINKIYQPEDNKVTFDIYSKGKNFQLLLSADPSSPRVQLFEEKFQNPPSPPTFCMVLRKHLDGGRINRIEQDKMDRIITIDILTLNELAIPITNRLIIEIMGRHSNIILVNLETNKIIDSIKKVDLTISRERQILPGLDYISPPDMGKANPLNLNKEVFLEKITGEDKDLAMANFFHRNFLGLSPIIGKEICLRTNIDFNMKIKDINEETLSSIYRSFKLLMEEIKEHKYNFNLIKNKDKYKDFHVLDLDVYEDFEKETFKDLSNMLESYYEKNHKFDNLRQKSQSLKKLVENKIDTAHSKLKKQYNEFSESKDRDKYKVYADLISAYSHEIGRGQEEVSLKNFYCPDMSEIKVPLDIKLSPHENAQKYYKKYSKLKTANKLLERQIPKTRAEIDYLDNVLISIENSSDLDNLEDIKDELSDLGYIKKSKRRKTRRKSEPYHFINEEGYNIYVGKNNRQNDELTLKFANKDDIWLHVQAMPGSHVIIRNDRNEISQKVLEDAANLAAYFSKARQSNNVAVDYTERKNVTKAKGAKLGMVIYDNFETIFVKPSLENIKKLKRIK